ncbi:DUF4007 family protein [Aeromonas media]|uniref:DUF4007 family protein n=1 Tax=Aeromonas media TaxID=651 RepID=UPI00192A51B9|nr:DUF4007 family protein [Aeromonas media]
MSIESCTLRFSGHQTFPLRYGWIFKYINTNFDVKGRKSLSIEEQMIRMGVGKNMVASMQYWMKVLGLIDSDDALTPLAKKLFINPSPLDRDMDFIGTTWLLHWVGQAICGEKPVLNASRWWFNYSTGVKLDRTQLCLDIESSLNHHARNINSATLKKDVDCLFATYAVRNGGSRRFTEENFTSPFAELDLIVALDSKTYLAELSERKSLPDEIFTYALINYLKNRMCGYLGAMSTNTIAFTELLGGVGTPGRVFRLSADGLSDKLDAAQKLTHGIVSWTDTQGLRQVQFNSQQLNQFDVDCLLTQYYSKR